MKNGNAGKYPFAPGDMVEIKGAEEILPGLDERGCSDDLPFMREMLAFCGKRFVVKYRLEKTCVEGQRQRFLPGAVTLKEVYCNGSHHDDCSKMCPLLWKESWLKPADLPFPAPAVKAADLRRLPTKKDEIHYFCQSTELERATTPIKAAGSFRLFYELRSGNMNFFTWADVLISWVLLHVKLKFFGRSSVQPIGQADKTPLLSLDLQPGEKVRVKKPAEIATTLDKSGRNRGLLFTPEMVAFCGRTYRVRARASQIIDESTAEMKILKNTVILDGVTCKGWTKWGGCSRQLFHLWREAWLERSGG